MDKTPILKKIFAIIALWALTFVGGTMVMYLYLMFSPERLPGWLVMVVSGGLGVALGALAMSRLTLPQESGFRLVNFVVLATVLAVLTFLYVYTNQPITRTAQAGIAAAVAVANAIYERKQTDTE